jgi:hypothetical protein
MRAGLLRVHSRKLAGAKVPDCLREAYDVCASAFEEAGEPLTEELLTERIPAMVFGAAVEHKWEAYPPVRHRGRGAIVGSFLEGGYNPARDEVVPQTELTETFGGYRVMKGYEAAFKRRYLECRIVHWRAEALTPAVAGGELPPSTDRITPEEPQPATVVHTGNSKGTDPRAQVDAFIERVFEVKGRRITRTDIWRVAGYTEATQFERFQRNRGASVGSIAKFTNILKLEPAEFLERLDRLNRAK